MKDFWLSCGHHLLDRADGGGLLLTDEFLKAYLARPELAVPPDACAGERNLHRALLENPRRAVAAREIAAIADPDARENFELLIAFRDRLLAQPTLEAAYLSLARNGVGGTPPLFLNHLMHVILRNALDGCEDPFVLRTAELFFRPQRITSHEGALLAADEELISGNSSVPVSPLVSMLGLPGPDAIDILNEENAHAYWERSDRFDFALDLTAGRRAHAALAQVIARFLDHMLAIEAEIEPLIELRDAALAWYVGLDAAASKIGDRLWNGEALDQAAAARVLGLYRLRLRDAERLAPQLGGDGVYLILATTPDGMLRMKPQNLLAGLPVRSPESVS
jgi:Family of unknown function (DUF6352)